MLQSSILSPPLPSLPPCNSLPMTRPPPCLYIAAQRPCPLAAPSLHFKMGMKILFIMNICLLWLVGCCSAQSPSKIGLYKLGGLQRVTIGKSIPHLTHGIKPRVFSSRKLLVEDFNRVENISKEEVLLNQDEDNIRPEKQTETNVEKQEGIHEPAPTLQNDELKRSESKSGPVENGDVQREPEMKSDNIDKKLESRIAPEKEEEEATMLQETNKEKVEEEKGEEEVTMLRETDKEIVEEDARKLRELDKSKVEEGDKNWEGNGSNQSKDSQIQLEKQAWEEADQSSQEPREKLNDPRNRSEAKKLDSFHEETTAKLPENGNSAEEKKGHQQNVPNTDLLEVQKEEANHIKVEEDEGNPLEAVILNDKKEEASSEPQNMKLEDAKEQNSNVPENIKEKEVQQQSIEVRGEEEMPGDEKQNASSKEEIQKEFREEDSKAEIKLEGSDLHGHDINEHAELVVDDKTVDKPLTDDVKWDDVTREKNKLHGDNTEKVDESTERIGLQQSETESTAKETLDFKDEAQTATNEAEVKLEESIQGNSVDPTFLGKLGRDPSDDDYSDLMQELADLPSKFQETAGKVANHLRPDVQRWTDTSKVYFNLANQQMMESFSPLVGKQYAPFLASLISYALLLLPLLVVLKTFEHIRAILSLQKVLLFVNIYLAAYFATLVLASFAIGIEPMSFFYKNSPSNFLYLQLLQALGYVIYLILQTVNIINSCRSETIVGKLAAMIQWIGAILVGLHYYVTVFHPAVILKPPRTNGKFYAIYSVAFFIQCLFARVKWVKKQYINTGDQVINKKN